LKQTKFEIDLPVEEVEKYNREIEEKLAIVPNRFYLHGRYAEKENTEFIFINRSFVFAY